MDRTQAVQWAVPESYKGNHACVLVGSHLLMTFVLSVAYLFCVARFRRLVGRELVPSLETLVGVGVSGKTAA
jgi:hypothetical protein